MIASRDGKDWDDERALDSQMMNQFLDSGGEIDTYLVGLPKGDPIAPALNSLRGFSSCRVEIIVDSGADLPEQISAMADAEWVSVAMDASGPNTPEELGSFMVQCSSLEIPYQILGLPGHLVSGKDGYGLLNVFTAAALSFIEEFQTRELIPVLECSDLEKWRFGGDNFFHEETSLAGPQIADLREIFLGVGVNDLSTAVAAFETFRI